jgi:hypothetical protein
MKSRLRTETSSQANGLFSNVSDEQSAGSAVGPLWVISGHRGPSKSCPLYSLDSDVLAFDIAQFLQRLPESLIRRPRRRLVPNEAQTGQLRRLLCLDGKRQPNKSQRDQTYGQKDVAFHSRLQRYKRGIVPTKTGALEVVKMSALGH